MNGSISSVDFQNAVEDLSGIQFNPTENPYGALIEACQSDHSKIQKSYDTHRASRNAQQKKRFLSPEYNGLVIDQYLLRLVRPDTEPGFRDPRNCFVIWARPPQHIINLALQVQGFLKKTATNFWLMPSHCMHLTVLEVAMCKTEEEILSTVSAVRPYLFSITSHTFSNRSRLVKPQISFDLSAFALSFVPASGEPVISAPPTLNGEAEDKVAHGDSYTYHHLRRDIFEKVRRCGIDAASRYQVPSAHITLGRFVGNEDHDTPEKREAWLKTLDEVNQWLEDEIWTEDGGEWIVGQQTGLDARSGTLWYGGGRTIQMGEGF